MLKAVFVASSICLAVCSAATRNEAACSRLYNAFVAPCCWHESVGLHQSPQAEQMRREIAELVGAGKTEPEIRALYIARYGERILVEPEGLKRLILNVIPWTALALGFVYLVNFVRRGTAVQESEG
jgi:cytochrome c-type biogenesis protein CcmH/NrfF